MDKINMLDIICFFRYKEEPQKMLLREHFP